MKRAALFLIAALPLLGCEEAKKDAVDPPFLQYAEQTSPGSVLHNLQISYLLNDPAGYSRLLADDFQFFLNEETRQQNHQLPVFWTRLEDSTQTMALFEAPEVTDIRVVLWFDAQPKNDTGRPGWVYIDVLDTFLEVDISPGPGELEGTTFRVDGQKNRFYFRKGKSPEDTDSETWYLVEWRDFGMEHGAKSTRGGLLSENSTWTAVKAAYR